MRVRIAKSLFVSLFGLVFISIPACQTAKKTDSATGGGSQTCVDRRKTATNLTSPDVQGLNLTTVTAGWDDIKAILTTSCLSCHQPYATYDGAKAAADLFVTRTDLNPTDPQFMPPGGQRLSLDDRKKLIVWAANGAPEAATTGVSGTVGTTTGTGTVGTSNVLNSNPDNCQ